MFKISLTHLCSDIREIMTLIDCGNGTNYSSTYIVSGVVKGAWHEDRSKALNLLTGLKQARKKPRTPWKGDLKRGKELGDSTLENYLCRFDLP
jgi:hypothetical protein